MFRTLVYTAFLVPAIAGAALAGQIDFPAVHEAGLKKLVPGSGEIVPDIGFSDVDGGSHAMSDYRGKVLLVNFWATWCAPCREEMPSLDAVQAELGGDDFEVLTVAAGRNPPEAIARFFDEEGIENLPRLTDARMELARSFGVMGLPVTVLVDREGREAARLIGDADWNSDAAKLAITGLMAP